MLPNDSQHSPNANLCRHLTRAAQTIPNELAVAMQKQQRGTLTYQEINFSDLNRQSDAIAYALNAYGIKKGMKAVLMVTPSIEFFALTFALFKAGIVPILVDPGMGIKNLKQCFEESQPEAFIGIAKAHIARKLFGWGKSTVKHWLTVGGWSLCDSLKISQPFGGLSLATLLAKYPIVDSEAQGFDMVKLTPDEMCAILFTSGSTGVPKGVVYSHKMFEAQISALKNDYEIVPGERDLATFPLFSLFGPALGMASIVPDMDASKPITANPDYIFAAIEKYQCTNLFANPALLELLSKDGEQKSHTLPTLKRVISAGAPATLSSIKRFSHMLNDGVEILNSYGATESLPLTKIGSIELLTTTEQTDNGGGICVGRAVDGVSIAVIAITEDNIEQWQPSLPLPVNEIGEIVVAGPMVSQQYYQRQSATKASKIFDTDLALYRHRMGDLGYIDEQGRLWMCGRKAHRVDVPSSSISRFYSIPCERIFNTHTAVNRTALVAVTINQQTTPVICVELTATGKQQYAGNKFNELTEQLMAIGAGHKQTKPIIHFIEHADFPVDVRHNAKIFREKLAVWAQTQFN